METRGKFIVLYGSNNIGKTEQARRLTENLNAIGVITESVKYPIYDLEPTGQILNRILRKGNPDKYSAEETQKIFAQNRFDYQPELEARLSKGYWVVAEDYKGTGIAWGLTFGVPMDKLLEFNKDLLKEDLAICLDGERFSSGIERNHLHEGSDLWDLNRAVHQEMSNVFGWEMVNSNQNRENVAKDVLEKVVNRFRLQI
ncbi:MAG TPA: hypothetical protein VKC54_02705 [Patescibacteria group bacterium]|nr:hypothetical protein [Patescibacteria group bacterium]